MAPLVRKDGHLLSWDGSQCLSRMSIMANDELSELFARKLMFADRLNLLQLLQSEIALYCAVLLCAGEPGLTEGD